MARFLARRLLNYVALCLAAATFVAFALTSLTVNPLAHYAERQPPPPALTIAAERLELNLDAIR